MRNLILAFAIFTSSMSAMATDFGSWFCNGCNFGKPGTSTEIGYDQALEAISRLPWPSTPQINDTVTICNGVSCVQSQIKGAFNSWTAVNPNFTPDPGVYKNASSALQIARSGSQTGNYTYTIVVHGHDEWWDYYSDGVYVTSGDKVFVVDYYEVTYHNGADCSDSACGGSSQVNS